jgi:hypothetical protein
MKYTATFLMLISAVLLTLAAAAPAQEPEATHHIRGRVLSPQGTPVAEVRVCARPLGGLRGRLPCEPSDGAGNFSIPVAAGETYFITAGKEDEGYADSGSPFHRVPFVNLPEVIVAAGRPVPEVTFHLGYPSARIQGRVTDAETGQPVPYVRVRLCRLEAPRYCHTIESRWPDGHYRVLAPPAPLAMLVTSPGYEDWTEEGALRLAPGSERELDVALSKSRPGAPGAAALPAPEQIAPADGTVFSHYPRTTTLEWAPVRGAASYTVEVELFNVCGGAPRCPETSPHQLNGDPPQSGLEATRYEFNFIGAQPGRWRVRAVGPDGRAGANSPWSTFVYKR